MVTKVKVEKTEVHQKFEKINNLTEDTEYIFATVKEVEENKCCGEMIVAADNETLFHFILLIMEQRPEIALRVLIMIVKFMNETGQEVPSHGAAH